MKVGVVKREHSGNVRIPLPFDQALKGLLAVKPEPKAKKEKPELKKKKK